MKLDIEITAAVWQGADVWLLARLYKMNAQYNRVPIVASDIASIAWANTNAGTGGAISSGTFTPGDVVLAALSYGSIWPVDSKGFNFVAVLPAANLTAGVTNRVKVTYTTAGTPARVGVARFRIPAA